MTAIRSHDIPVALPMERKNTRRKAPRKWLWRPVAVRPGGSVDLRNAFPGSTGYSPRNLRSAKQLYLTYSNPAIWLQPVAKLTAETAIAFLRQIVAEIPWGQNLLILNKLTAPPARLWYLRATARFDWSRNVLLNALLNDKERGPGDQPSIGIILCAENDDVEVEYALRSKANSIGVAVYRVQSKLPGELKGKLPTAKQFADIVRIEMEGGK